MSRAEAESDFRKNRSRAASARIRKFPWTRMSGMLVQGDKLLLCTDGLVNMVKDPAIREIFQERGAAAEYAHQLVNLAIKNGGKDNVTVIVAHINPSPWHFVLLNAGAFWRQHWKDVMWAIISAGVGALCFYAGYYYRGM